MSKETFQIAKRPGIGREGKQIRVRTNFFEVTKIPEMKIIHYYVTIFPKVSLRLNRKVFNHFSEENQRVLGGVKPVFDGARNMFTHKSLPFQDRIFDVKYVELEEDNAPMGSKRPFRRFTIRIRKTRDIFMDDLFRFLLAKGNMTWNCKMAITAMGTIISHEISINHPTIQAWPGYYQLVRPTLGKMMINIDSSATTFYEGGPLIQIIAQILRLRSLDDLRRGLSERDRQKVEKIIKNLRISDNHIPKNRRKFKIEKLTQSSASNTIRLLYPVLPCVVVGKNYYLPIEVCDVIPGQRHIQKLNEIQTADMYKFTCQPPSTRANKIMAGLNILDYRNNEYLKQFGMAVSNDMTVVNARILPTPTIQYHQTSSENRIEPKVASGATLGSWSVLAFLNERDLPNQAIKYFLRELITTCNDTGMNIVMRDPPICHVDPSENTEESLKKAWFMAKEKARVKPQLILCILSHNSSLYAEIKRVSDTVIGVATQCILSKKAINPKKQYCANVCLKMNVKLGGENSFLIPEHIQFVADQPTILMGADITHPSPGDYKSPSYAALCGSMNARASHYIASLRVQTGHAEIIVDLENMVKELLRTFYQTHRLKPKKILFYRDGVSKSRYIDVLGSELTAIKDACHSLEANYKPTITFVLVKKRRHTRFFPIERQNADRTGNCLPGTVIETGITHPFEFDFYLLSHAGIMGTSRPTHYQVLYDENGFDADRLQTLSYNLCHTYARCTRAVSLVPPVYYAHLAATRAKLYSSYDSDTGKTTFEAVKEALRKVMYFI
ncbi:Piwi-domain-containing protein [Rhizophagus irregularis]|uniref:Piwi-domain-containing protein n=1 Tax=Rhizophagus irregularis TaxID=588596 RepID=A0A2I1H1A0_9GLOM|nr:Piwi-domain-containing protein [Rhizophagus irregularis]